MHISTTRRHYVGLTVSNELRDSSVAPLGARRKTVRNETLANLSHLPAELIEALRAGLSGKTLLIAGEGLEIVRSLPHGTSRPRLRERDNSASLSSWTGVQAA